jgi:hypothetical protein
MARCASVRNRQQKIKPNKHFNTDFTEREMKQRISQVVLNNFLVKAQGFSNVVRTFSVKIRRFRLFPRNVCCNTRFATLSAGPRRGPVYAALRDRPKAIVLGGNPGRQMRSPTTCLPGRRAGYFAVVRFGYGGCRFQNRVKGEKQIEYANAIAAVVTAETAFLRSKASRSGRGRWEALVKLPMAVACLISGAGALSGCSQPANCYGGNYRGGCLAGTPPPASYTPYGGPVGAIPYAAPAGGTSSAVPFGDPSTFADVDDKQCRSYGLAFGSHDYADCRIRLSAQHRGLDPNSGTTTPPPGNR